MADFLRGLFRICPVLTVRSRGPAYLGVVRGQKPICGAFPGRLGRRVRMTILCNSPLPADLPRPWRQKKEAPLPARILTIIACQTGQDLNRMLEKPVQIWTGCPRTPPEPTTGERHVQEYPWIRVVHSVHFLFGAFSRWTPTPGMPRPELYAPAFSYAEQRGRFSTCDTAIVSGRSGG